MTEINLDKAPLDNKDVSVVYKGKTFKLPGQVKMSVFRKMNELSKAKDEEALELLEDVLAGIFGPAKDAFMELDPSFDEVMYIIEQLMEKYGKTDPKSAQSAT